MGQARVLVRQEEIRKRSTLGCLTQNVPANHANWREREKIKEQRTTDYADNTDEENLIAGYPLNTQSNAKKSGTVPRSEFLVSFGVFGGFNLRTGSGEHLR